MSARAGVRDREVVLANVRVMAREGLIELELLRIRREIIFPISFRLCNVVVEAWNELSRRGCSFMLFWRASIQLRMTSLSLTGQGM